MATRLTGATVGQAKAGEARREIPDGGCAGLYLVVQPDGAKSWAVRFRSPIERDDSGNRKTKKLTLGPVADDDKAGDGEPTIGQPLTLADARSLAAEALRKVKRGIDPATELRAEKQKSRHSAREARSSLVEDVFAEFLAKHVRKRNGDPVRESTRRKTGRLLGLEPDKAAKENERLSRWIPRTPRGGVLAHWAGRDSKSITKRDVLDLIDAIV